MANKKGAVPARLKGRLSSNGFPLSKKGKCRQSIGKKPLCNKRAWKRTKYNRSKKAVPLEASVKISRTLPEILGASAFEIGEIVIKDGYAQDLRENKCPKCLTGNLAPQDSPLHLRCTKKKGCGARLNVLDDLPIFTTGGNTHSLQIQAAVILCMVAGLQDASTSRILGVNKNLICIMRDRLDKVKTSHVLHHEKKITYGNGHTWTDVEADEATFRRRNVVSEDKEGGSAQWEQWVGVVQRGHPEKLYLKPLDPEPTVSRAPGPGPIKKLDWEPICQDMLVGRKVVLHTDSARSYSAVAGPGLLHDRVVHQKKRVFIAGKPVWLLPQFVRLRKHRLPPNRFLRVKAGTQVIDRFWSYVRQKIRYCRCAPGSLKMHNKIRSVQHDYWNRGKCKWSSGGKATKWCMENPDRARAHGHKLDHQDDPNRVESEPPKGDPVPQSKANSFDSKYYADNPHVVGGSEKYLRLAEPDGNCLFHCFEIGLESVGIPLSHESVRTICAGQAYKMRNSPVPGMGGDVTFGNEMMLDRELTPRLYKKAMEAPGEWGGWIEICAFAQAFKIGIGVYCVDAYGSLDNWQSTPPSDDEIARFRIMHDKQAHYDGIFL
eukprot:GEMP01038954.1.p1 GENE.GEMP01038954.1~~GEMP01038954.1.p1  ORF type:complete len:602 (+),score=32.93 GEMP01038954.1:97-1902(+)